MKTFKIVFIFRLKYQKITLIVMVRVKQENYKFLPGADIVKASFCFLIGKLFLLEFLFFSDTKLIFLKHYEGLCFSESPLALFLLLASLLVFV